MAQEREEEGDGGTGHHHQSTKRTKTPPFATTKQILNTVKHTYVNTESNIQKSVERVQQTMRLGSSSGSQEDGEEERKRIPNFLGKGKASSPVRKSQRSDGDKRNSPSKYADNINDNDDADIGSSGQQQNIAETALPPQLEKNTTTSANDASSPAIEYDPLKKPTALAILCLSLLAKYVTFQNWDLLLKSNQVPLYVMILWIVVAALIGKEVGVWQTRKAFEEWREFVGKYPIQTQDHPRESLSSSRDLMLSASETQQEQPKQLFSRTRAVMDKLLHTKAKPTDKPKEKKLLFWTTLSKDPRRKRQRWELFGNVLVSKSLTNAVLRKSPTEQRTSLKELGVSMKELEEVMDDDQSLLAMGSIHENQMEKLRATSLEDVVVEPLCRLRGLDVFLTDAPEKLLGNHSFLIKHGLRDRPTFLINVLTQWGNIMMYFELPAWVKDWDAFVEEKDDPDNVIATKRFLNGDDEYRNKRLKCLPCLVDGPGPMRYIAPARKTKTIVTPRIPSTWKKHPPKLNDNGDTIWHPCLEFESDLMANSTMRSVCSMVKRYIGSMVADAAILIEKPDLQQEDEPTACLGMIRFDRIDLGGCSELPPRLEDGETEIERDMHTASVFLGTPVVQ